MKSLRARTLTPLLMLHLALIFGLGLGVRLLYWGDARGYAIGADEPDYVLPAQTLVRDGQYVDTYIYPGRTWTRVPLTSLAFALSFLFVPDEAAKHAAGDDAALMEPRYDALNFIQIAESLITVAITMLLAARIFPQRGTQAAIVAGYVSALYPALASSPAQRALSEPTAILLSFAALYALSWWSPEGSTRRTLVVAGVGGALLGLAALARPMALVFLPFVLLWLFGSYRSWRKSRAAGESHRKGGVLPRLQRPVTAAITATLCCLLCISPWTLYNYNHYGRFLLLDTASINAYWDYHNYKGDDIPSRVASLPNPADRFSLSLQEGTANMLQYPDRALGSVAHNFLYLWHLQTVSFLAFNTWDMTQRDPDVPDTLHTDAAFLLVALTGVCGLAGLGLRRPGDTASRALLLLNLWLLSTGLLGLLIPYDARYRLPAIPALIVLASGLLALADWRAVFTPSRALSLVRGHPRVVAGAVMLCGCVLAGAYSPDLPLLLRSLYSSWRGDLALAGGDGGSALARYEQAQQSLPTFFYGYRREADAARQLGMDDLARREYALARQREPDDAYGILGFADLVSRHPEWTLTADERKWLSRPEEDWRGNPWNSFHPSPAVNVDVGAGGDIGYLRGFYTPDVESSTFNYRWSKGHSWLRVPTPSGQTYGKVRLRMSAPAIGPSQPLSVTIAVNGGAPITLQVPPGWADYALPLRSGGTVTLEITCPTLKVSQFVPNSNDPRSLGVGLDRVTLVP